MAKTPSPRVEPLCVQSILADTSTLEDCEKGTNIIPFNKLETLDRVFQWVA